MGRFPSPHYHRLDVLSLDSQANYRGKPTCYSLQAGFIPAFEERRIVRIGRSTTSDQSSNRDAAIMQLVVINYQPMMLEV
jgi:hypothetical protein